MFFGICSYKTVLLKFSLPTSKPFFVILHLRKDLTLGAQYNESLDSIHLPEALEKLTLGVVGQLVDIEKKQMDWLGFLKKYRYHGRSDGHLKKLMTSERGERVKEGVFLKKMVRCMV